MTPFQAAVLGLIQGVSEFLPISSSGHLVLGEALLGVSADDLTFEVFVHFGTLLAVFTALRHRVWALVSGCLRGEAAAWRMALLLGVGTVPAGVIGILFEKDLEVMFSSPAVASGWLLFTGAVLWSTRFRRGDRREIGLKDTVLIGLAQAFAILPGISRSGMTISTGLWRGLNGGEAGAFSFLLSIPVILGATALKVGELVENPPAQDALIALGVGTVVAYASGVLAIRWLLALLRGGRMDRFAYYCWAVGLLGLVFFWR